MTRREWLAALGLSLAGCGPPRASGYPGAALIALSGEESIAAIDLLQFRFRKAIPLGSAPSAVVAAHKGDRAYVLTPATGSIHVIDSSLKRVGARKLADELSEIHLTPDGHIVAVSASPTELIVVDPQALNPARRVRLATGRAISVTAQTAAAGAASAIAMDIAGTGDIALSLTRERRVMLLGVNGQRNTTTLAGEPGQLRFRADGKLLIVTRPADRILTVLSVPQLRVIAELPLAMEPKNLCFTPDGGQLFVTGPGMDGLAIVFPYNTLEVEQTILAGHEPGCMACADRPTYLFVASSNGSTVSILDVPTRKLVALAGVGLRPHFIAITPDDQYALILDEGSGDMAVLRIPEIRHDPRARNGAALFALLTVGDKPVHAGIVSYHAA